MNEKKGLLEIDFLREEFEKLREENERLKNELEIIRYKEKINFIQGELELKYATIDLKHYKNNDHFSLVSDIYKQKKVDNLLKTGTKFEDIVYAVRKFAEKKYAEELKEIEELENE